MIWQEPCASCSPYSTLFRSVLFNGSAYVARTAAQQGQDPTNTAVWSLMAQKGDAGATGAVGESGAQGLQGPNGLTGAAGAGGEEGREEVKGQTRAAGSILEW